MNKLVKLALCGAFMIVGQAASAVEHEVLIERRGFFPEVIHAQPGDTIKFVNESPNWARLYSDDSSDDRSGYDASNPCADANLFNGPKDGWYTGWIRTGSFVIVAVTPCMETSIESPYVWRYSRDRNNYRGTISFESPNLGN